MELTRLGGEAVGRLLAVKILLLRLVLTSVEAIPFAEAWIADGPSADV